MKNRIAYILVLVLLLGGGMTAIWVWGYPGGVPKPQGQAIAGPVVQVPVLHLPEVPCAEEAALPHAERAAARKPTVVAFQIQDSSLQATIDLLNSPDCLEFPDQFHEGHITRKPSDHKFERTANGFQIQMPGTSFLATPTYADGYLYTSGGFNSESFYAISTKTGKARWAVNLSDDGPSSALVLDSVVIFNTESCTIFALDRFTGKQIWSKWIGDPLLTHPVTDGKLVFTSYPGYVPPATRQDRFRHLAPSHPFAALNVKTGKVAWQRWLDGDVMTTPVVHGDDIYLTTFAGSIYRLDKESGKIRVAAELQATSLPTIGKDYIYTTQRHLVDGKVGEAIVELDPKTLAIHRVLHTQAAPYLDYRVQLGSRWTKSCAKMDAKNGFVQAPDASGWVAASELVGQSRVSSLQNFVGSTVVQDGARLYSTMGDTIVCIDLASGEALWRHAIAGNIALEGGHLATMPLVCGNYVVTVTLEGEIRLLDKLKGTVAHAYATHQRVRNQPIVVAGRVMVTSTDGKLTCIDTQDKQLSGWAMFMKNNAHDGSVN